MHNAYHHFDGAKFWENSQKSSTIDDDLYRRHCDTLQHDSGKCKNDAFVRSWHAPPLLLSLFALSLSISLSWFDLNNSDSFVLLFIFVSFENWAIQLYVTQSKPKLIVMVLILFPRNGYSVVWKSWCGYPIVLKPRKWFWWHENQVRIPTTVNRCERARFSLSIFSLFCFSTFRWQFIFSNRFYVTAALFFPRLQKK